MKLALKNLQSLQPIEKLVIHSFECSLYQASVRRNGEDVFITDQQGRLLRSRSVLEMQAHFRDLEVVSMVLRQTTPYDEMIGQPLRTGDNALEVPLSTEQDLN